MSSPSDPPDQPDGPDGPSRSGWEPPGPRGDAWAAPGGEHPSGGFPSPGAGNVPGYGDPYAGPPPGVEPQQPTAYGGPFGPGSGGWAPKPGVVPLRPLALGEILDGAVSYIRAHPRVVLGTSAIVAVVAHLVGVPLSQLLGGDPPVPGPNASPTVLADTITSAAAASLPQTIVVSLATVVLTGLLMVVISRAVLGAPVDAGEAWRAARPRLPGLIGVTLLTGLIVAAVAFVGAVPGFLLVAAGLGAGGVVVLVLGALAGLLAALGVGIALSLAPPIYVLEGGGVVDALRRSWTLVRPRFWPVLGITVLASVIAYIISVIVVAPFGLLAAGSAVASGAGATTGLLTVLLTAVGGIIGMTLVTPFQAGVTGLLYVDQRMRREGFDIELQRAASFGSW